MDNQTLFVNYVSDYVLSSIGILLNELNGSINAIDLFNYSTQETDSLFKLLNLTNLSLNLKELKNVRFIFDTMSHLI